MSGNKGFFVLEFLLLYFVGEQLKYLLHIISLQGRALYIRTPIPLRHQFDLISLYLSFNYISFVPHCHNADVFFGMVVIDLLVETLYLAQRFRVG
jgi:hypothetical protein